MSPAEATAKRLPNNTKYNIWLFILNPKIDFLLGDSFTQKHSFTAMFAVRLGKLNFNSFWVYSNERLINKSETNEFLIETLDNTP